MRQKLQSNRRASAATSAEPGAAGSCVGVDGCREGWVCVTRGRERELIANVLPTFEFLLSTWPGATIAIDIPIGLPDRGPRDCDLQARRLLGARRSSVFPAPLRCCLGARTHEEASALRRLAEGKGINIQTWGIFAKIREVDAAMSPSLQRLVAETHPELVFVVMNDGLPLSRGKKSPEGIEERLSILLRHLPETEALVAARPRPGCALDDLLDATALLWSAERRVSGAGVCLPELPPVDARGLRMELWY